MHPCGAYRDNSLLKVLEREPLTPDQPPLFLVHRLDRVTSGVVVMGKSNAAAAQMAGQIRDKETCKIYLARVRGRFPDPERLSRFRTITDQAALTAVQEIHLDDGRAGTKHERQAGEASCTAAKKSRNEGAPKDGAPMQASSSSGMQGECPVSHIKLAEVSGLDEITASKEVGIGWMDISNHPQCSGYSARGFRIPDATTASASSASSSSSSSSGTGLVEGGDYALVLRCPIGVISFRDGKYACEPEGRQAVSLFRCVGEYHADSDTSLVECRPLSGRTHQLRLHLQLLGCPIANDPCYGGELFYGDESRLVKAKSTLRLLRSRGMRPLSNVPHILADGDEDLLMTQKDFDDSHAKEQEAPVDGIVEGRGMTGAIREGTSVSASPSASASSVTEEENENENENENERISRICRYCHSKEALELETMLHCDGIWLHAQMYTSDSGQWGPFESAPPVWASDPFLASDAQDGAIPN